MEPIFQRDPSRLSVESFSFPCSAKHVGRSYPALQHADRNLIISSDTVGRRLLAGTLLEKHREGGRCIGTQTGNCIGTHPGNRLSVRCRVTLRGGMGESGGGFKKKGELRAFENVDELATNLADYVSELSEAAVKERGAFAVALSGGSLIGALGKLTEAPYIKTVDWAKWHVFWADERVVAKNHPDSNYKLAKDGLLSKVPIIPGHVYSINDSLSAEAAAEDYEFGLRQLVKTRTVDVSKSSDCPKFDLILLGMGPDGHIASLFPDHPLINEKEEWIAFIADSSKPPPERITFTLPVINAAANVVMVVTGVGKAATLQRVMGEELPYGSLPAQMVSPKDGKLVWFADKEAASKLTGFETYIDVVRALCRGDLRLLRHALQEHEDQFLRSGVYLVLEKLELQVYQRLIKKIYIFQKQKDPSKAHQVKMDIIVKALKWLEIDMDIEEVECIMAILIHKNLIRGYFSHKSKVVVLSKQDPFPKLSGRPVNS